MLRRFWIIELRFDLMELRSFLADLTVTIYEIMPGLRLQIIDAANGIENKLERRSDRLTKMRRINDFHVMLVN